MLFKKTGLPLAGGARPHKSARRQIVGDADAFADPRPPKRAERVETPSQAREQDFAPTPETPPADEAFAPSPEASPTDPGRGGLALPKHLEPLTSHDEDLPRVLIVYSSADQIFIERLIVHLSPLRRIMGVHIFDDAHIVQDMVWRSTFEDELGRADVIVHMVSADLLASDLIMSVDYSDLLENAHRRGARLIVVYASPCFVDDSEIANFHAVNTPQTTLQDFLTPEYAARRERIHMSTVQAIRESIRALHMR